LVDGVGRSTAALVLAHAAIAIMLIFAAEFIYRIGLVPSRLRLWYVLDRRARRSRPWCPTFALAPFGWEVVLRARVAGLCAPIRRPGGGCNDVDGSDVAGCQRWEGRSFCTDVREKVGPRRRNRSFDGRRFRWSSRP
jgi:hypothetical protein